MMVRASGNGVNPRTPYIDAIDRNVAAARSPVYALPAHQARPILRPGTQTALFDTAVTRYDRAATGDLHAAAAQLNVKLSALYGGDVHVLTIGGSAANRIALKSLLAGNTEKRNQPILIDRNAHVCVHNALADVPRAMPRLMKLRRSAFHAILPPAAHDVAERLAEHRDTAVVVISHPTIGGLCADIRAIVAVVKAHNLRTNGLTKLHVDQAWGPHFAFADALPAHALHEGADTFATSFHKQLDGAMGQTAAFGIANHLEQTRLHATRFAAVEGTTSPSSPLLMSADAATGKTQQELDAHYSAVVEDVSRLRAALRTIPGITLVEDDLNAEGRSIAVDPLKVTFRCAGLDGLGLKARLAPCDFQMLVSDGAYASAHFSARLTADDARQLARSVATVARETAGRIMLASSSEAISISEEDAFPNAPFVQTPHATSYESALETVPYLASENRICADMIMSIPPGVPVVMPGQLMTAAVIDGISALKAQGASIKGLDAQSRMLVVKSLIA